MQQAKVSSGAMLPQRNGRPFRHIPVRSFDPESKIFYLQTESGETRLGVCYQANPMNGADDGTMERLKSVLTTSMPAGSFVQFGLFSEPDVDGYINAYLSSKTRADGLLAQMTQRRAEFIKQGVTESLPGMQDVHLCRQRVIFSITIPCDTLPSEKELRSMRDIAAKMSEGLSTAGLSLIQMDEGQYIGLLRRFVRLYNKDDFVTDEFTTLREQVFAPADSIQFGHSDITFNDGEYYAKVLSIKHFPPVASIGLMNMLIGDPMGSNNQLTIPFWISATIHYADQHKKLTDVRTKHLWLTKQQVGPLANWIPSMGYKKAGVDILIHEIDGGGGTLCELNFTATLFSRDHEQLNGATESFRAWAASYGFDMREDKRIMKELFYLFLPMGCSQIGIRNLYRFQTMAISHAIRILPIIGNWAGTGSGAASIFLSRRGTPVLFDPYDSAGNQNGIIIAGSGAGKSVLAQQLLCDWMAGNARCWVIDQGRSMEKLCRAKGGQFIEFKEGSDICLNPFTFIESLEEEMPILKAMFTKMAAPEQGLLDFELGVMEEKITAAWEKASNEADVTLVAQLFLDDANEDIRKIGRQLYSFTRNGTNGHWFNGRNNVDFTNDFVVLELKELENKKTLQQVVLIQLFSKIGQAMYHTHGRPKALLIDEAWSLLGDPVMAKAIEIAYRTVRKHHGSAWLITQSIGDVYSSASGLAIVGSAEYQIIMNQREDSIESAIRSGHLKMDVYQMQMLKSVHSSRGKYSEMMIRSGDTWGVAKFIADRFSQILFSTSGWERDEVFERMSKGEDVVKIIDQCIAEGR